MQFLNHLAYVTHQKHLIALIGTAIGVGMVDLEAIVEAGINMKNRGYRSVSPFFVPRILPNLASGHVSIQHGLQGPNHCASTACATGQ